MPKFYTLEDMTQEDLNKLALERNTFANEIERLTNLCNKYEEEHKTTFEKWKKDIQVLNELEKWLNECIDSPVICKAQEYYKLRDESETFFIKNGLLDILKGNDVWNNI